MEKSSNTTKKQKITPEFCPNCREKIAVELDSGDVEVFECQNCKFKIKK